MASVKKRDHEQKVGRKVQRDAFRSGAGAHDETTRNKRSHKKARLNQLAIDMAEAEYDEWDDWDHV